MIDGQVFSLDGLAPLWPYGRAGQELGILSHSARAKRPSLIPLNKDQNGGEFLIKIAEWK